jgi:hypothetical protein
VVMVDPDNDEIERFVVRRYAYDADRHERRHRVVAAFDNEREFEALLDALAKDLRMRREAGQAVDPREHVSGVVLEPGHQRRQRDGRLLARAIRRGVPISDQFLAGLDLPANVGILRGLR